MVFKWLPLSFPCGFRHGGDEEDRTPDPLLAKQVLSQLSYTPTLSRSVTLFILSSLKGPQN